MGFNFKITNVELNVNISEFLRETLGENSPSDECLADPLACFSVHFLEKKEKSISVVVYDMVYPSSLDK